MAKIKSLAQQIAELDEENPKEFDPEENVEVEDSEEESGEESDDGKATEHYVSVGKSKLRKPEEPALGPEYSGAKVSREALLASDDHDEEEEGSFVDPETVDLDIDEDGEIDSDDALGDDEEKFKDFTFRGSSKPKITVAKAAKHQRMTASDFLSASEDGADLTGEDDDSESDVLYEQSEEDQDVEELSDEDEDGEENGELDGEEAADDDNDDDSEDDDTEESQRAALKKMMGQDRQSVVATISQAATADKEKGAAVKKQRKTFDSLLNIRIRLQKALVATNSIAATENKEDAPSQPYQAAEEAAIKLFNSLSAMRHSLDKVAGVKTGSKRKREIDTDTTSSEIWDKLQLSETPAVEVRQVTLEKWSAKVKGATAQPISGRLNKAAGSQTIIQVLEEQLSHSDRLIKRTKMPRSCAPLQVKAKTTEDANIYDDADFYQLLLKELVDQRMVDSTASATPLNGGRAVAQWTAVKEAKTKKNVDTKASKGRKMKFTVHEKLQNFMAPEDRMSWEQDAIDRFFSTLLGQRMTLGEEEGNSDDDTPLAEEALMLFRS